jgi:hypothetical protein
MKTITTLGIVSVLSLGLATSVVFAGTVRVKGYTKSNGTYVAPTYRTSPNSYKYDNYSTKGNYNPYSGRVGTKNAW